MRRVCSTRGTEVEMFPAITPKDDPVKLLTDKGIDPKAFDEVYSRNLNCIAAFLSHYSLWDKCAKGNENFVIFEHDAFVHSPIPVNAKFAYVMNIGQPSYGSYEYSICIGSQSPDHKEILWWSTRIYGHSCGGTTLS